MKGYKKVLCLVIALIMMVSFAACGAKDPSGTADVDKQETDKKDEKVTLKMMGSLLKKDYDSDPRVKILFDSFDKVQDENPNITIRYEEIPHDAYQEKAQVLATANELPDIFDLKGSWCKNFVQNGLVMDLTEEMNKDTAWKDMIKLEANQNFVVDGKTYGLCLDAGGSTSIVFYNDAIFKECGINEFPKTMTEFNDAIKKIKAKGYVPICLGNKAKWPAESCYLSMIGNRFTGTEWTSSIIDRKGAKFTDSDFVDALKFFQDFANTGVFNSDLNTIDYKQARIPYYNKKAAMMIDGYWSVNAIVNDAPKDVLDSTKLALFPDIQKGKGTANMTTGGAGGWAYSLNSKLKGSKKDAAVKWLKCYMSEENAEVLYDNGVIAGMKVNNLDKSKFQRLQLDYFDYMDNITPCEVYDLTFDPAVEAVLESGLQELLINATTPEKLAQRIQEEYEKTAPKK